MRCRQTGPLRCDSDDLGGAKIPESSDVLQEPAKHQYRAVVGNTPRIDNGPEGICSHLFRISKHKITRPHISIGIVADDLWLGDPVTKSKVFAIVQPPRCFAVSRYETCALRALCKLVRSTCDRAFVVRSNNEKHIHGSVCPANLPL